MVNRKLGNSIIELENARHNFKQVFDEVSKGDYVDGLSVNEKKQLQADIDLICEASPVYPVMLKIYNAIAIYEKYNNVIDKKTKSDLPIMLVRYMNKISWDLSEKELTDYIDELMNFKNNTA